MDREAKIKELLASNGILGYKPHRKQLLFHRAGKYKFRYLRAGNRFGKSDCGSAEAVSFALGERMFLSKTDPDRKEGIPQKGNKVLIVAADWKKVHEIFTDPVDGKLFKLIPKSRIISALKKGKPAISEILVKTNQGKQSSIRFTTVQTYEKDKGSVESEYYDFILFDEPVPEGMFKGLARGLVDYDGKVAFIGTPLSQAWISRFFLPGRHNKEMFDDPFISENKWILTGSMRDNPYLKAASINEFEALLTPDEIQCRINGIPLEFAGLVYKEFSDDRHVYRKVPKSWDGPLSPPKNHIIEVSIDTHPKTPHAVLFFSTSPSGKTYVYHEIFERMSPKELAREILDTVGERELFQVICEPAAWIDDDEGNSIAMDMIREGLPLEKSPKDLRRGILATKAILLEEKRIIFHENLHETLKEFNTYVWKEGTEKPTDKDDHMMECLYRMVLKGLEWIDCDEETEKIAAYLEEDFALT